MQYWLVQLEKQHFRKDCSKNLITDFQNRKSVGITDCTFMLFDAAWSSVAVLTGQASRS
jgi:hypothetical protein